MNLSEQDKINLNAVPLVDVMTAWGYTPAAASKAGTWAKYVCPWHDDHSPSLIIDMVPRGTNLDCGFICMGCKQSGYGAIQLAARLMHKHAGELHGKAYTEVVTELAQRCGVELEGGSATNENERIRDYEWADFRAENPQWADWKGEEALWEPGAWTLEAIRALGFRITLAQRRAKREDLEQFGDAAEVRVGDLLTQYDPDTGEALYRCSLGRDFYRNPFKAEARTVAEWGRELERQFSVFPVSRFIYGCEAKQGGVFPRRLASEQAYPIFVFNYPWGVKKYEPRSRSNRWTWWNKSEDADLEHRYYCDSALCDWLEGAMPQADERHPFVVTEKDKDGNPVKIRFERLVLCSGPRDAMQVWAHTAAHVVWLHSERAGFDMKGGAARPNRWLRSLLTRLRDVTVEGGLYVCYDEDETGLQSSQAIALADPQIHWLRLPKELGQIGPMGPMSPMGKRLKDVTDFVAHFTQVEALMPADLQHDDPCDWFDNAMKAAPTCQFWLWQSERKEKDGSGRPRYKIDPRNAPVFLRARGMVRRVMKQGRSVLSRFFLLGNDHTFTECFPGERGNNRLLWKAREMMSEWLASNTRHNDKKGSLAAAIRDAKLEQSTLEYIEEVDFDDHSFGEDFDHFFFADCAVRVDAKSVTPVAYSNMKWWTNAEAIMPGRFSVVQQPWRIIINPLYAEELQKHADTLAELHTTEERAQENMRWDSWVSLWKYRLIMDKPLDEMPLHFRFLYNTCRIFWEKEAMGVELTASERQMQDMYFIAAAHAIGSALVRHRSSARQQCIHITDNGTRREELASGGTGKTAILDLLSLLRPVLRIDGKSLEGGNITLTQELAKVIPGLHSIVAIDELPAGFSPKTLYNLTLSLTARGLYRESMVLEGDDLPKFVFASNEQMDLSSDSTSRRLYQLLVGDYYHPRSIDGSRLAHTPADDFKAAYKVKEVARNLPASLQNEARNMLIACVQFFFQQPDETIRPPKDDRAMLRQALAASTDKKFTKWAAEYIGDKKHRGIPIAKRELAISLLDYCGIVVGEKTVKSAFRRLDEQLPEYIRMSPYVMNPEIVLTSQSDIKEKVRHCKAWQYPRTDDGYGIPIDKKGNRPSRELKDTRCYYFYPRNRVPKKPYDPKHYLEHLGDPDYVQPAPDKDPDSEV